MNREDIRKLLGGYATGTLTPEEQQALFEAALDDQDLFDALAREQPLRDLLRDPASRARLLAALDARPVRWYERFAGWKPALTAAGLAAVAVGLVVVVWPGRQTAHRVELAQLKPPPPLVEPAPVPTPAPTVASPAGDSRKIESTVPRQETKVKRPATPSRQLAPPPEQPKPAAEKAAAATFDKGEALPPPPPPPPVAAPQPVRSAPSRAEVAEAAPILRPREQFRGGTVGGVLGGIVGGAPARAGQPPGAQPPGARDLYYAPVTGSLPTEQDAANVPKNAEVKQRAAVAQSKSALGAASGLVQAALSPPAHLGVKYTILRKPPGGDFVEANPSDLRAGDTVAIRFEANNSGYLLVLARRDGKLHQVFSGRVEQLKPYTTPPLSPDDRDLVVTFSLQPQARTTVSLVRTQEAAPERATYVVSDRGAPLVQFTIKLDYK